MVNIRDPWARRSLDLVVSIMIIYRNYLGNLSSLGTLGPEGDGIINIEEDKYAHLLTFCRPQGSKDVI